MDIFKKIEKQLDNITRDISSGTFDEKIKSFLDNISNEVQSLASFFNITEMDKKYDHLIIEKNKAIRWKINSFLKKSKPKAKPFTIILPPPNVTGKLHLGHAWNGSLQDTIIRYKNAKGFDTLFIPSMDHAGIATQAKVEAELAKQNISRRDLGREKFVEKVWDWKLKYSKNIRKQWDELGLTLDFIKEKFTLDTSISNTVNQAFIDMYNDKLIYRSNRAIQWDCQLQTSLSNIEVIPKATKSKMYYLKYKVIKSDITLIVATTRPETLFSDVAVAINPKDKRFKKLVKGKVINPLTGKYLPIIKDKYVDMDKGTGAMKVSAHATADIEIIKNNNLTIIECIDKQGLMNKVANKYEGFDRFEARKIIADELSKNNKILKIEDIVNNVGYSQRSDSVIEILVSPQWYIKTKPLAELVLKNLAKTKDSVKFFPPRFKFTLKEWMENIEDWNISRQLWWGHQIPVWYKDEEIKVQINSPGVEWKQDDDVLDTWFSSSLAPFAFLDWPNNQKFLKRYYPTNLLVSAYDIIFFWIARMYFNGLYFQKKIPFHQVLIHGLIRDSKGRKMSKSLGNGIDPIDLIKQYGADSLRWFLLTNSSPGQDLRYSEEKMKSAWTFNNKLWNIARFIIHHDHDHISTRVNDYDQWIIAKLNKLNKKITRAYNQYKFTIIKKDVEHFIYNDLSSWYIEMSKDRFNKEVAFKILSDLLIMIHPIMPFITEDIYLRIHQKSITHAKWPVMKVSKPAHYIDDVIEMTKAIREFRVLHNLSNKDIVYYMIDKQITMKFEALLYKLTNAKTRKNKDALFVLTNYKLYICMNRKMKNIEKLRYEKLILNLENEVKRSNNILNNSKFISKAPEEKVILEKAKKEKYQKNLVILKKEYASKYLK